VRRLAVSWPFRQARALAGLDETADRHREDTMRPQSLRLAGLAALAALTLTAADKATSPGTDPDPALRPALDSFRPDALLKHIKFLSSDEFEGRAPGTAGEGKTVAYLTGQLKSLGLKPGNPDGSYVQDVPLVGVRSTSVTGAFEAGGKTLDLKFPDDWVAVSRRQAQEVKVENSDVVFVGYGVVAPEYGWDDYKGFDVAGKTIVMLINDPPVPDPNDPSKLDPAMFKGRAMTYYGRWTYKYEIAAEKGAAAAVIVHETGPAGYPYSVIIGSRARENFDIQTPGQEPKRTAIEAWITLDKAKALLSAAGQDFDKLKDSARRADFRPVPLNAKARLAVTSAHREVRSKNVLGRLEGSDSKLKDELIVYTAHWDHLGREPSLQGDQVFNGAADNASGTAALLEIARAFTKLNTPPKRSILFLAVTAEEKGLLGAKFYAENPLYPLPKTLADINMDVINLWGRTRDVVSVGMGLTTLDDLLAEAARWQNRIVTSDAEPEKGFYYRSDHFEFARQGVPALDPKGGIDYVGKPAGYGQKKRDEYTQNDYHKVTDEVKPDWDLSGAVEDLQLLVDVGYRVLQGSKFPEWKPGAEFLERRRESLSGSAPRR
jgi:Zn-dependent M28 family amino/carboxypeptidase